jgi:hypothetical protein
MSRTFELTESLGIYDVYASSWDYAEVRNRNTRRTIKTFKGETAEQDASRYAWDLYTIWNNSKPATLGGLY